MTVTLVLSTELADQIRVATSDPLETAGVLIATPVLIGSGEVRLLGREIHWVPEDAYLVREPLRLSIASHGYVPALGRAEELSAMAIWFHSHPGDVLSPLPSKHDRIVDRELTELFQLRTGSDFYGALIGSRTSDGLSFTGHVESRDGAAARINRLWEVGTRFRLTSSEEETDPEVPEVFDRNVRAFGGSVQRLLGDLRIAIVGCGGTGSAVAEQLVRLGVRDLVLVDPQTLEDSNVTRVYGSTPGDVGHPKVEVLQGHLQRIAPDAVIEVVRSMLTVRAAAERVIDRDLIFGCTDDNAGRVVLSRIASYLLVPVIDCGLLISSDIDGTLTGIDGRVTVMAPGEACLMCRGRVDLRRAQAEVLTPDERVRLENEGYAPALGRTEPAVVTFTTLVAATAVNELLERVIGFGPNPRPSEVLLRCHERELSTNLMPPKIGHFCDPSAGKLGRGVTQPFLEQAWPE